MHQHQEGQDRHHKDPHQHQYYQQQHQEALLFSQVLTTNL
jgi:hypothetical protein